MYSLLQSSGKKKSLMTRITRPMTFAIAFLLMSTGAYAQCNNILVVSDSTWMKSTVTEDIGSGRTWDGAPSLPAESTYTVPVSLGQPYAYYTMDSVDATTRIIIATNKITFYRTTFLLGDLDSVSIRTRLQMTMDDGAEVYINGYFIAREDTSEKKNWKLPAHDALFDSTGAVTNGYMGGQTFDTITMSSMSSILKEDTNEIVVAMFNLASSKNRGGFSLKLSTELCPTNVVCTSDSLSVVSDSNWAESTVVDWFGSGDWGGASSIPAEATFTLAAQVGQPYGNNSTSVSLVPGTMPIKAENQVRYFKTVFNLADNTDVTARLRMYMDDGAEVYINGHWLVREESIDPQNFKGVNHDILFSNTNVVTNGFSGGQMFDTALAVVDMDTVFATGSNTIIVALRNLAKPSNEGGFSFRLDISNCGDTSFVFKRSLKPVVDAVDVFPNPTNGLVTVSLPEMEGDGEHTLMLFDVNGRLLQTMTVESQLGGSFQDLRLDYSPGLYILKVQSGDQLSTLKIAKR